VLAIEEDVGGFCRLVERSLVSMQVNATPPAVRVVEFVRDPWDVSTSNYAYTLKGAEDWMFREKEAWGGLSFYDAVHAEEGPLSAALFSIWEEMNLMQNIDENVPNVLYVRFEDMIASLQATINRFVPSQCLLGTNVVSDLRSLHSG